jgi:carbonic anhydrase
MTEIDRLLDANKGYAAAHIPSPHGKPSRRVAVVTCMDARIDVFAVLGLHLGEAHVIRNAGGRVTEDTVRSLTLSSNILGVDTVVVMQHTQCGLAGTTDEALRELTGATFGAFFSIDNHHTALQADIEVLASKKYLGQVQAIAGFLFDVDTGKVEDVVRWERPA